jgi:hypothetical protein
MLSVTSYNNRVAPVLAAARTQLHSHTVSIVAVVITIAVTMSKSSQLQGKNLQPTLKQAPHMTCDGQSHSS